MAHFAKIDSNNIVTEVIVSEKDFINSGKVGDEFLWIQTSYNGNFRKKFASVGDTYDKIGYVDSDSMIHWDAPNPFDLYTDEWCWSKDYSNLRWTYNSSNYYQKFYPDIKLDLYNYYSSAIKFFTKEHKPIFDGLIKLYEDNNKKNGA